MERKVVRVGRYDLMFNSTVAHAPYVASEDIHGVEFTVDGVRYDVVGNRHLGERLIIRTVGVEFGYPGSSKDIPFHRGTFGFLPECITAVER